MMASAARGRTDIVQVLVGAKAELRAEDRDGKTALDWAEENDHADAAALLKEAMKREDEALRRRKAKRGPRQTMPRTAPVEKWNGDPLALVVLTRVDTYTHGGMARASAESC